MNEVLSVKGLCKTYPAFRLDNVDFSVAPGSITGFIGRNGAGKTTTLKSLLNLVHPDAGELRFFGLDPAEHEAEIRQRIGYAGGTNLYYPKKKLGEIAAVTAGFYQSWDEAAWRDCLGRFALDPDKRLEALSEGMKVKFNLALALSHRAELLILDEPTSGLDPRGMVETRKVLQNLKTKDRTLLISTHILSEVSELCGSVTMIRDGKVVASGDVSELVHRSAKNGITLTVGTLRPMSSEALDGVSGLEGVKSVERKGENTVVIEFAGSPEQQAEVTRAVFESGAGILSMNERGATLESMYMELTEEGA